MPEYVKRLALKTFGVFTAALAALAVAAQPFNVMTFEWDAALTVSGSAAVLALLEGLAGRFTGDKDAPTITR